jgi:hypothetical protein
LSQNCAFQHVFVTHDLDVCCGWPSITSPLNFHLAAEQRLAVRSERSAPLVAELEEWMRGERARLSRPAPVAQAID